MATNPQQPKERDGVLSALNVFIEALNIAKEISSITPAKAVFGSVAVVLMMVRVCFFPLYATTSSWLTFDQESMVNQRDYVELALSCADICGALDRGTKGKGMGNLNQTVREAINRLTTCVEPGVHSSDS